MSISTLSPVRPRASGEMHVAPSPRRRRLAAVLLWALLGVAVALGVGRVGVAPVHAMVSSVIPADNGTGGPGFP